ncbi:MAG: hypothetical protein ACYDD6_10025 [Acidimicrobiales bacterium]
MAAGGALLGVALPSVAQLAQRADTTWVAPANDSWQGAGVNPANPAQCDPIDPAQCMLPYPNDWFTRPDPTSATGRRLNLNVLAMPRNINGKPIDPSAWNRSDGFSSSSQILTVVPGMTSNSDLAPSHLPSDTNDPNTYSPSDVGVILLDTKTGENWPVWAEIDQYTSEAGIVSTAAVQQDLMIHPAVNLADGTRYIVALRNLATDNGSPATPSAAFLAYRDGTAPASDPRSAHMNGIFSTLAQAGWTNRSDIYLAWDFTTASTQNVTGRLLAIRNQSFAQLGETPAQLGKGEVVGSAPSFSVTSVTNYTPQQNGQIARQIAGYFTVPCFIAPTCSPPIKCNGASMGVFDDCPSPGQFALGPDPDAVPHQVAGQTYQANFLCNVGRTNFDHNQLLRPVEYGHGLFGGASEINSDAETYMADQFGMMYCATDWFGMASADVPNAVLALSDLSYFPVLTDRVQQGELNFLFLQRLMIHPQGFASSSAFQWNSGPNAGKSFIDPGGVYYDGNSQGGIYGGTVCAVSIDVKHCVLGVFGMDYALLLPRSVDYVASETDAQVAEQNLQQAASSPSTYNPTNVIGEVGYSNILDTFYPDQAQRMLILDLIQGLWDRSDPAGYASHMTGGLPNTPSHQVLLQMAWGDHQVANVTAETEARSIGASLVGGQLPTSSDPALTPTRYGTYQDPFWGIPSITSYPYDGSALAVFDTGPYNAANPQGTAAAPSSDTPPNVGNDPHEFPRRTLLDRQEKSAFMEPNGVITDQLCPQNPKDWVSTQLQGNTPPCPAGEITTVLPPYFSYNWNGTNGT